MVDAIEQARLTALAAGGRLLPLLVGSSHTTLADDPVKPDSLVKTVYVVFKCHLDVGFTDSQAHVLKTYFDTFFPQAISTAAAMRAAGGVERYVWTTGSWLLYRYLKQASPNQQARITEAVAAGDMAWHGLPFNLQSEMLDSSLCEASLNLSRALDRRFGVRTTGAKMTDVPGHSRGIVGPLARAGVTFLHIGINPASKPADVPPLFRWRDANGAEVLVMYQPDYGGTMSISGTSLAVSINVRPDNSGVHTADEIKNIYAELSRRFPNARIVACSLSTVAAALEPVKAMAPLVTREIGDSWIHGCASDPVKIARFRDLSRLRREWLRDGKLTAGSDTDLELTSWLILAAEHTWGCDIKTRLASWNVYTPAELRVAQSWSRFKEVEATWAEKRSNLRTAIASLPENLAAQARNRVARSTAAVRPPDLAGLTRFAVPFELTTQRFVVKLDPATGAIRRLKDRRTGREWASPERLLGLFSYETFSGDDYRRFLGQYITLQDWWPPQDFGKPGLDRYPARSRIWEPSRHESYAGHDGRGAHRIVTQFFLPDPGDAASLVAWPRSLWLEWTLPDDESAVHLRFLSFGKAANRLPEAMWLSFAPIAFDPHGWRLDKMGSPVDPLDIVHFGGRGMHAVQSGISYKDGRGQFALETPDAPLIAPGKKALLNFDDRLPPMNDGFHVNLFNNVWGTNYVMWIDDDMAFRFVLRT